VLSQLENSQYAVWIRNELWGWPLVLTVHVFGTALVVGFILIISLRLLGFFKIIPYTSLERMLPLVWLGIVLQVASGAGLWMTKPTQYVTDTAFLIKAALVLLGIILTVAFQATIGREAPAWETSGAASARATRLVAAALVVWCVVLVMGRLTAHLGSLYLG
jgi:hypothetical protein